MDFLQANAERWKKSEKMGKVRSKREGYHGGLKKRERELQQLGNFIKETSEIWKKCFNKTKG